MAAFNLSSSRRGRAGFLRGWHFALLCIASLLLFRLALRVFPVEYVPALVGATWLLVTALLTVAGGLSLTAYSSGHRIARASAGAAALTAIGRVTGAGLEVLWSGEMILLLSFACAFLLVSWVSAAAAMKASAAAEGRTPSWVEYFDLVLPSGFAALVARELKIIGYAIPLPGLSPRAMVAPLAFSNHLVARPMLFALLAIAVVELAVGHIVLQAFSRGLATAHLIFGLFFILYIAGIARSFARLPTVIDGGVLKIRMSVLFEASVPLNVISSVGRIQSMPVAGDETVANGAIIVAPNLLAKVSQPVWSDRMFKPRALTHAIAFYVDRPDAFLAALASARTGPG